MGLNYPPQLESLPDLKTVNSSRSISVWVTLPWKSKTKQRMVLRMIHVKDSLLPMVKVWPAWTSWDLFKSPFKTADWSTSSTALFFYVVSAMFSWWRVGGRWPVGWAGLSWGFPGRKSTTKQRTITGHHWLRFLPAVGVCDPKMGTPNRHSDCRASPQKDEA